MAFIKVKNDEFWNPTKLKDAAGNDIERTTPPNDNDYLDGWLMGYEENQGKDKNSNLYSILLPDSSAAKSLWGSALLNEQLTKVPLGSYIRVQWTGKVQPKVKGGRPYHTWQVYVDIEKGLHPSMVNNQNSNTDMATAANNLTPPPSKNNLPF